MSSFAIYDPLTELAAEVAQIENSGAGGGGLPLGGGTLTGDLTLTSPAKVIQSQAPVNPNDLTNKAYVDNAINGVVAGTINKAGNTQFGTIEFDPSGDLVETAANSGIALLKQPAAGTVVEDVGFDSTGKFVSTKLGVVSSSGVLANGTPYVVGNLQLKVNNVAPISLQLQLVSGSGYVAGSAQPYYDSGSSPVTPNVTGRYIYRAVNSTGFVSLSERVTGEPTSSTVVTPAFDTSGSTDASESGSGYVEIYNIFVNDSVDNGVFRITVNQVNVPSAGNSYITLERLSA